MDVNASTATIIVLEYRGGELKTWANESVRVNVHRVIAANDAVELPRNERGGWVALLPAMVTRTGCWMVLEEEVSSLPGAE